MDILLVAIAGVVLFVVARSFMQYEQNNLQENRVKENTKQETEPQESQSQETIQSEIKDTSPSQDTDNMQLEVGLVIALMARLSKSDGKICRLEKELLEFCFKDFSQPFPNPEKIEPILRKIFENEQDKDDGIQDLALQFYKINKYSYTKRTKVLQHLINLAYIDKVLSISEEKMLKEISDIFKINNDDFGHTMKAFKNFYEKEEDSIDIKEAYYILESNENSTIEEIKAKYKILVKKYHPDLLQSRGFEDDYVQDCTRRLQQINEAYEYIKKHRK